MRTEKGEKGETGNRDYYAGDLWRLFAAGGAGRSWDENGKKVFVVGSGYGSLCFIGASWAAGASSLGEPDNLCRTSVFLLFAHVREGGLPRIFLLRRFAACLWRQSENLSLAHAGYVLFSWSGSAFQKERERKRQFEGAGGAGALSFPEPFPLPCDAPWRRAGAPGYLDQVDVRI